MTSTPRHALHVPRLGRRVSAAAREERRRGPLGSGALPPTGPSAPCHAVPDGKCLVVLASPPSACGDWDTPVAPALAACRWGGRLVRRTTWGTPRQRRGGVVPACGRLAVRDGDRCQSRARGTIGRGAWGTGRRRFAVRRQSLAVRRRDLGTAAVVFQSVAATWGPAAVVFQSVAATWGPATVVFQSAAATWGPAAVV